MTYLRSTAFPAVRQAVLLLCFLAVLPPVQAAPAAKMSKAGQQATVVEFKNGIRMLHNAGITGVRATALKGFGMKVHAQRCLQDGIGQQAALQVLRNEEFQLIAQLQGTYISKGQAMVRESDYPVLKKMVDAACYR